MNADRRGLERRLTASMLRIARGYRREVDRALAAHGMSEARALPVLHIARRGEGVRQGVVADDMGIEGPSLVRLLDQLCASRLVERRDDPEDGRAKLLYLTEDGRSLAAVMERTIDECRSTLLANLSNEDLSAAMRAFGAFEAALQASSAKPRKADG